MPGSTAPGAVEPGESPRFPSFGSLPPDCAVDQTPDRPRCYDYEQGFFELSQDYPSLQPENDIQHILDIAYDDPDGASAYLLALRDYIFEGNIDVQFEVHRNAVRTWYHVPWQHWGSAGREALHGLTREATSIKGQLAPEQRDTFDTYAVGFYNPLGGYTIGQVWADANHPQPSQAQFLPGTVVAKLLFTEADERQVPYLTNPITWGAWIYEDFNAGRLARRVRPVQLIQMDVMVRDPRHEETGGWVFGTYIYNGELTAENPWERLRPLGLQWGDDPGVISSFDDETSPVNAEPRETRINPKLLETILNVDEIESGNLPPQHLGWGGRLAGAVDNFASSCKSCHGTAQWPQVTALNPSFTTIVESDDKKGLTPTEVVELYWRELNEVDPGAWMSWFQNRPWGEARNPEVAVSLDFSLQLQIGIGNFHANQSAHMGGVYMVDGFPNGVNPTGFEASDLFDRGNEY